jgi:phosphoribosylformimino-5-aminoimidazole carboxamide ribotide isomerase
MQIIPVVDLLGGQVVRAVRGDRAAYRPIDSSLCEGSQPDVVAAALNERCASGRLYVADIDALTGNAPQAACLRRILDALPDVELWLDAGFTGRAAWERLRASLGDAAARVVPVYASESLASPEALEDCGAIAGHDAILSLDRKGGIDLDSAGCWTVPALWPRRVIVMTLDRVGAQGGPDLDALARVRALRPDAQVIGAGGIRDRRDLGAARAAGAYAWLVASALHDGGLDGTAP